MTTPAGPTTVRPRSDYRYAPVRILGWLVLLGAAAVVLFIMRIDLVLAANTPTGGDMGAHVLVPAYLRDSLLPEGRLIGWSNDWYAGFPILYFYFPLPALTIVLLDVFLPYGVALKLVTVAGLAALPFASYYFVRCMGLPRPVALVGGLAGSMFIFMESFTIFGGNTLSTLAGEYSFSWSFALSLVYLGMVIRNSRDGRGFTVDAAVVLALTALSHLITTLVVVLASLPLLFRRRGSLAVIGSWAVGFVIAGFWALPVLVRMWGFTTDMKWQAVRGFEKVVPCPVQFSGGPFCPGGPGVRELWPILLLAAIGVAWAVARKASVGPAVVLMAGPIAGYFVIEYVGYTKLYNARLLPYWYFTAYLFAGIAVGLAVVALARRLSARPALMWGLAAAAGSFLIATGALGVNKAPHWAGWNYSGYEAKEGWSEYRALMDELERLPDGRVMWEANRDLNRYGTPMALMLTGYWVPGKPSMEGLLFESSITTPFHFLNASEVSHRPSNPISGLSYRRMDFSRAVPHLRLFNVAYYISYTEEATAAAVEHGLEVLAEPAPFTVFSIPESSLVEVARFAPVVWAGESSFTDAALDWYDDVTGLDLWLAADGPADWLRVESLQERPRHRLSTAAEVADVVLENHRISFTTTAVGVPHLVKVSHFPNWTAIGAEGPYRAAPSLMVVIPEQESVVLEYRHTWVETLGMIMTVLSLVSLAGWVVRDRRRRRRAEARAEA